MKVFRVAIRMMVGSLLLGAAAPGVHAAESAAEATLSAEASQALSNAEFMVSMAKKQNALWTSASDALAQAQTAAKKQDSAAVIKSAAVASEQAFLGLSQMGYPLVKE